MVQIDVDWIEIARYKRLRKIETYLSLSLAFRTLDAIFGVHNDKEKVRAVDWKRPQFSDANISAAAIVWRGFSCAVFFFYFNY